MNRRLRGRGPAVAAAVVLAGLGGLVGCAGRSPRPAGPAAPAHTTPAYTTPAPARPSPTPSPGVAGRFTPDEQQLTFTEPAHRTAAGQPLGPRTLVTQVWLPRARGAAGPFPLLIFAPGFRQCLAAYSELLRTWASAGYVVAAVNFPRTSCQAGTGAYEPDLVNQPADLSYVLSQLLLLSARSSGPLAGLLNPREVAAAGQSDGGDTVAALAGDTCCRDGRIRAVAVMSGAEWPMPGRYFAGPAPPALFTQGDADTVNPPWMSRQLYQADDDGTRYYLDLLGASHLAPYEGSSPVERLVARVTVDFFDRYLLGQAGAGLAMLRDGNVRGVAALAFQ